MSDPELLLHARTDPVARREEAVAHLLNGKKPSQIARSMQLTVDTVLGYLYQKVGEGKILRSQILYSIPASTRQIIEAAIAQYGVRNRGMITRALNRNGHKASKDDVSVYMKLRHARVTMGDTYDFLRGIEILLHIAAKTRLIAEYGEASWWKKGVPERIRVRCAQMFEESGEYRPDDHPYCYTTLLQLEEIYKSNWRILSEVMHPPKNIPPTEEQFRFVQGFFREIEGQATGVLLSLETLRSVTVKHGIQ